ncbi:MAG: hypothetical protein B6245_15875 [Desulfobacteraceae bacterium 4572_88]|nr:MAG: hypothetical protein B6245_15875 [Desulfobacteraceae bacterium 4572_88]
MSSDRKNTGCSLRKPPASQIPSEHGFCRQVRSPAGGSGNEFGSAIFGLLNVSQNIMRSDFFYESSEIQ